MTHGRNGDEQRDSRNPERRSDYPRKENRRADAGLSAVWHEDQGLLEAPRRAVYENPLGG
jgi:hypothetical protein